MENATTPLVIDNLSKSFGGLPALAGIKMNLNRGERRVLIGPNGAGKTTLFNLISGFFPPSSGKIWIFGKDVTRMSIHKRAVLGVARTFQITNLLTSLSVLENILLPLQTRKPCRFVIYRPMSSFDYLYSKAQEILEPWELWEYREKKVHSLSYGQQRELEIIMALAQQAKLLLLDEPTSGLSPAETTNVVRMLCSLPQDVTILVIEHDMDVAFDLADTISVLHLGKLVAEGSAKEIQRNQMVQQIYLGRQA